MARHRCAGRAGFKPMRDPAFSLASRGQAGVQAGRREGGRGSQVGVDEA